MRTGAESELRWEAMLRGIQMQADWLRTGPAELLERARELLHEPPPRIYLTGCGDSHYAGVAARLAFERWSGIPTQAVESLELSRYELDLAPPGSWAVCVSNSGRVVRTVEAAAAARERGLTTVAVTYAADSRLAETAEATLAFRYDDPGFGPGTISYVASLGALYALAARAAELSGFAVPFDLPADAAAETLEVAAPVADRLARELPDDAKVDILGGGPSYGTALFGRAKFIESAHSPGGAHELEEWAHEEFFCTRPGVTTIVVAPPGASYDRALEQLEAAKKVGALTVVVSEADPPADLVLPVAAGTPEELTPLTYCVPLELLAYHYASTRGLTMLGFDDADRRALNYHQIFGE